MGKSIKDQMKTKRHRHLTQSALLSENNAAKYACIDLSYNIHAFINAVYGIMVQLKTKLETRLDKQFFGAVTTRSIHNGNMAKTEIQTFKKDALMFYRVQSNTWRIGMFTKNHHSNFFRF
jgi:hypothetical protein